MGCAGSPTTRVSPYSWDDPYWKAQNYESKDPESVIVKEVDLIYAKENNLSFEKLLKLAMNYLDKDNSNLAR